MKAVCDRGALLDAINLVTSVVSARSPRPQLACVRVQAFKDGAARLVLTATDAEVSLSLQIDRVEVSEAGDVLIPADKLGQIVRAQDNEPTLTITSDGDVTHIRGHDAHYQLRGFPGRDFAEIPALSAFTKKGAGTLKTFRHRAGAIGELVRRSLFAAARENSRYAINGVLLRRDGKKLEMVATDGRRLALARTTLTDGGDDVSCIVPSKALNLLQKIMGDPDEPVSVAVSDTNIVFGFDAGETDVAPRAILASNLVDGTFPPYQDVIPRDQDIKATFDRDVLASAVRRAALLTNEESRGVRMTFNDEKLQLTSRVPEMGEAEIDVPMDSFEGKEIAIGFNPQFITDALKVIEDPVVSVELKAPNKPGLLRSGSDFVYVVMPVTLQ